MSFVWPSVSQLADDTKAGKSTATDNVRKALDLVNEHRESKAILSVLEERALELAAKIDAKVAEGSAKGRLLGVPFIAKDNILIEGSETTAASNILKGFVAPYTASCIKYLEDEGAICIGKANLDAFGHGGSTENSDFQVTINPHDPKRVAGGSSGGSAVSVVLGMVPFALGTDTGGSSRQPASFSGCVGYKPTYGLISRYGVIAMASSTDVVGILSSSAEDTGLVLDVLAKKDNYDSTQVDRHSSGYAVSVPNSLEGTKIGVVKEYMGEGVDPGTKESVNRLLELARANGAVVEEVSLPSLDLALAIYYILVPAEISSNLGRYDGQKYGFSAPEVVDLSDSYSISRSGGFGKEAKRRIMIGTHVLSSGYYDAYYKKAQLARTKLINDFNEAFKKYDFLVGPTTPGPAFKIGENSSDPLKMYLEDIMTVAANLCGIPSASVPSFLVEGLPQGLQAMAPFGDDSKLLEFAAFLQNIQKPLEAKIS